MKYSTIWCFLVVSLLAPGAIFGQGPVPPVFDSPAQDGYLSGEAPELVWQANSINQWVQVWLGTASNPTAALIADEFGDGVWVQSPTSALAINDTILKSGSSLPPGDYQWWIRGWANGRTTGWVGPSNFSVLGVQSFSPTSWQFQNADEDSYFHTPDRVVVDTAGAILHMPLILPDGAQIVSVEIFYENVGPSQQAFFVRHNFRTRSNPPSSFTDLPQVSGWSSEVIQPAQPILVSNYSESYSVRVPGVQRSAELGAVVVRFLKP